MKLSTLPRAVKIAAIPAVIVLIATPVFVISANNNQNGEKTVNITSAQTKSENDNKQTDVTPVDNAKEVQKPLVETQPTAAEQPTTPVSPYPEGSNIWHAFNRRTALGLVTPEGAPSDQTYWQRNKDLITKTPTQHAIIFGSRTTVLGMVESVNADGSLTVSCTNCAEWNVLTERRIEPSALANYLFLQ